MFSRRNSAIISSSPTDKKRRFSWRRSRETEVAALPTLPQTDQPPSPTSGTLHSSDVTSPIPPILFFPHLSGQDSIIPASPTPDDIVPSPQPRTASSLGQVLEITETSGQEADADSLPAYAQAVAMTSAVPVTYGFVRKSPFAMVVSPDGVLNAHGHGLYHISVGFNIWMPSCTVTTIRRGSSENGPIVAEVE